VAELKLDSGAPPLAVPAHEAAALLGCGRSQVFKYLAAGKLERGARVARKATPAPDAVRRRLAASREG